MEIISPKIIWREWNNESQPLHEAIIRDEIVGSERTIFARFTGESGDSGDARVFVRCSLPVGIADPPFIVAMLGDSDDVTRANTEECTSRGYGVCIVDYAEIDTEYATEYPASMSYARFDSSTTDTFPLDVRNNAWISQAKNLMRAVYFVKSYFGASRIGVAGVRQGADAVYKAAAFCTDIDVAVTVQGSGMTAGGQGDEVMLSYEAGLKNSAYASLIKSPILVMALSNDVDNSVDELSQIYSLISGTDNARLSISERMAGHVGYKQNNNIWAWLDYYLRGIGRLVEQPKLEARPTAEGKLYYELSVAGKGDVELFISQGSERSSLRNWHSAPLIKTGEHEYICTVDVYDTSRPIYAFANMSNGNMSVSSVLMAKMPATMGIKQSQLRSSKVIYDGELGVDDWFAMDGDIPCGVGLSEGAFGIGGVSSQKGGLNTRKIAEQSYAGKSGDLLCISLCSAVKQKVDIILSVSCNDDRAEVEYKYSAEVSPSDNWLKLDLSPQDFISVLGNRKDWRDIFNLKIIGDEKIIVKSVMWV